MAGAKRRRWQFSLRALIYLTVAVASFLAGRRLQPPGGYSTANLGDIVTLALFAIVYLFFTVLLIRELIPHDLD